VQVVLLGLHAALRILHPDGRASQSLDQRRHPRHLGHVGMAPLTNLLLLLLLLPHSHELLAQARLAAP
jgi:hypothetical protein